MLKVISGGTIIGGAGGEPIENGVLIIDGTRIHQVGSAEEIPIPPDGEFIDAKGRYLIPGLIDTHIHLDLHGMADTFQENLVEEKLRALRAAVEMEDTLRAGFTTVRNVGSVNGIDFAVKAGIEAGYAKGPRILTSGRIITMTCSGTEYFAGMYRPADGVDDCRRAAREQLASGADCLKVMATGAVMNPGGVPGAPQLDVDEMKAVVDEGWKLGRHTAAHAHGARGIVNAVKAGCRTIEHGTMADREAIEAMAEAGAYLVPTMSLHNLFEEHVDRIPQFMIEKSRDMQEAYMEVVAEAIKAGVQLAMGTDAGTNYNYHGKNAREIVFYVRSGLMSPRRALTTATHNAAQAIMMDHLVGSLEPGRLADLVVLNQNPLENISSLMDPGNVAMVLKDGQRQF